METNEQLRLANERQAAYSPARYFGIQLMIIQLRFFISVALALTGCAQMSPFYGNSRTNPVNSIQPHGTYSLAFIEFGEQGSYQDPTQLENALALIKETPKPLVVTYVHGWQNNAKSGDAETFSRFLQQLTQSEIVRTSHFNVVGVYLGWRGRLTSVPVAKELTFFSRRAAAERLASNFDCYDAGIPLAGWS